MRTYSRSVFMTGLLWAALGGLLCAAQPTAPGIDEKTKTVTVGASTQFTGGQAFYSQINMGADSYFKWLNDHGGINGWKVNYVLLDDGYQPANALANARRLVEREHVFAIVANEGTATNVAASHFLAKTSTPVLGPTEGSPPLATYENYFVLMPNYAWEAGLAVDYAVKTLNEKKVGILYENDDLGIPARDGAAAVLKSFRLEPVATVSFDVHTTDFSPYVSQLAAKGARAVIMWGANSNAASALRAAHQISFAPKWFMPFWVADGSTVRLAGPLLEGVYFTSWFLPLTDPKTQTFVDALQKYSPNTSVGGLAENGWCEASLFAYSFKKLLESHAPITQANFMRELNNMRDVDIGLVQHVSFSKEHHNTGITHEALVQAQGGKFVRVIEPRAFPPAAIAITPSQ